MSMRSDKSASALEFQIKADASPHDFAASPSYSRRLRLKHMSVVTESIFTETTDERNPDFLFISRTDASEYRNPIAATCHRVQRVAAPLISSTVIDQPRDSLAHRCTALRPFVAQQVTRVRAPSVERQQRRWRTRMVRGCWMAGLDSSSAASPIISKGIGSLAFDFIGIHCNWNGG